MSRLEELMALIRELEHAAVQHDRAPAHERKYTLQALIDARAALERALRDALEHPEMVLSDEDCDRVVAQTMDRVAAEKGMEHAMYLSTDIAHSHTLRRALIRTAANLFAAAPKEPTK